MKKLAIICALAMVFTMIAPFAAVSAATDTNGVLYWDFENNAFGQPTDDIALLQSASNGDEWKTDFHDTIGTGAWSRQIVSQAPCYGAPHRVTFDHMFDESGASLENSERSKRIAAYAQNNFTDALVAEDLVTKQLEGGGTYCVMVPTGQNSGTIAQGMVIALEDTELIPDMPYTLEFDAFVASEWSRAIFAGFGKPSERPTSSSDYPWFVEGNVVQGKKNGELVYAVNTDWTHMEVEVTPSATMYENGTILLYIAGGDVYTKSNTNATEFIYFDNIKLTPKTTVTDKPAYTKFNYGKVWDFEKDYHVTSAGVYEMDGGIPGNAGGGANDVYPETFANGDWSLFTETGDAWFRGPRIRSIADAKLYNNNLAGGVADGTDDGFNGSPAPGSEYCTRMRPHNNPSGAWNKYTLGMRVKLTKEEFPAGDYTLSFYSGWTMPSKDGFKICASLFAGEKLIVDAGDEASVKASFADATQTFTLGTVGRQWSKYTQDITFTDADFDENGVATLILYTSIAQLPPSAMLYFDDISLVSDADMIPSSGVLGFVTTASYTNYEDAMIAAGLYYDQDASYLIDADSVKGDIGRVTHSNIKLDMVGDAYDEGWPTAKIYMFDKFFAPILDAPLTFE